jgi:hypothetical protein
VKYDKWSPDKSNGVLFEPRFFQAKQVFLVQLHAPLAAKSHKNNIRGKQKIKYHEYKLSDELLPPPRTSQHNVKFGPRIRLTTGACSMLDLCINYTKEN